MMADNKKEVFKLLIKEFQESSLPKVIDRDLVVPLKSDKIVTVFGPRRSGKSFFFYNLIKKLQASGVARENIVYLNFEDDRILPLTSSQLKDLLEAYYELFPDAANSKKYFFFDEIQNIIKWELFVRRIYDKEKCAIFVTGSSSKLLSREIATSLRGRTLSYALYPLNFREFLRFKEAEPKDNYEYSRQRFKIKNLLDEFLEFGGFPEVVLEENVNLKRKILREYFELLVYRDLVERFSLKNTELLRDILKTLFTDFTKLYSVNSYYKSIKQRLAASRETVADYLGYIKETNYFFLLSRFSYSLKEQRVNPKKIIALDNGLRNIVAFRFAGDSGRLAENLVGSLLSRRQDTYYWQERQEVDFVVKENSVLRGLNISVGPAIEAREVDSLFSFAQAFSKSKKDLLLITKDKEGTENKIKYIPLHKWLLEVE